MITLTLSEVKGNEEKKCFYCGSEITKKYGFVRRIQRYKCLVCGRQFIGGERLVDGVLWGEYTKGKQTYAQLAARYGCSMRTIQRRLDKVEVKLVEKSAGDEQRKIVVVIDTTYFGRDFGVLLIRDGHAGDVLYRAFVKYETNALYAAGVNDLRERGYEIGAIVCDGRKGLIGLFENVPVQMCQFHQIAIVTRYLTRRPKTQAAQELRIIALTLAKTDKDTFIAALTRWFEKWNQFLNERTVNPETLKSFYTHKRLRSAYRSLRTNLPWLFTFSDHPHLGLPKTTNSIDGLFAVLKNKLRCHNGLSKSRRMKFIDEFFKA